VEQPWHWIEGGNTNSSQYLQSPTGNRRFWPILVGRPIDLRRLKEARLQLWGEAAHYQAQGEGLTLDEALWPDVEAAQEERRVRHPWEALIDRMTVVSTSGVLSGAGAFGLSVIQEVAGEHRVHSAVIFEHVLKVPGGQLHRGHAITLQEIMQQRGWTHRKNFKIEGQQGAGYARRMGMG
jgi:predicted P-loop ATPase